MESLLCSGKADSINLSLSYMECENVMESSTQSMSSSVGSLIDSQIPYNPAAGRLIYLWNANVSSITCFISLGLHYSLEKERLMATSSFVFRSMATVFVFFFGPLEAHNVLQEWISAVDV